VICLNCIQIQKYGHPRIEWNFLWNLWKKIWPPTSRRRPQLTGAPPPTQWLSAHGSRVADPWSSGSWEWRTLGVADPGNGDWRTVNHDMEPTSQWEFERRILYEKVVEMENFSFRTDRLTFIDCYKRGHPFMTSTKNRISAPISLSTCVHMSHTPPLWTSTCGWHEKHIALLKRLVGLHWPSGPKAEIRVYDCNIFKTVLLIIFITNLYRWKFFSFYSVQRRNSGKKDARHLLCMRRSQDDVSGL